MKWQLAVIFCFSCCILAQQDGGRSNPVTWKVSGPSEVAPGGRLKIQVTARIEDGWHLYSLKKQEEGPIPTSIEVSEAQSFSLAGPIDAPAPLTQRDELLGFDVEYYLAGATFTLPITASKQAPQGPAKLFISARYQACDNQQCLPPRTVRLEHPLAIKAK